MHTLNRLKHIVVEDEWSQKAKDLKFIDFKLGNICNLKCRICGSWSSSQYAAEEIKYNVKEADYHKQMMKDGAWPRENGEFWNSVQNVIGGVRYLEFTGGEPFMIREHFQLLQSIVDQGIAHQVEIHYNTNGTIYPEQGEHIWKHFKTVEIAFSIDALSERFEYQRTNAVWSEVTKNISRFRELKNQYPNIIQLQVCSTVNVYNVCYLEELANWIDQQEFDFVYWNVLQEPYFLSAATMPDSAKELAIQKLTSADVSEYHKKEFSGIVDFIKNGVSLDGKILILKVDDLDWKRKHDLRAHHPELATAIGYNGPTR
jgi:MoaA/NifB/PqqE/SkfB family radical SAM enzyme